MRIIQLIDSLEAGGAERMAVSYANSLAASIEFSGLLSTRIEGVLKDQLSEQVNYLFLSKKNNFDGVAFFKLRNFILKNKVQIIHAHGSSFFWATLLKITYPTIKIIWHDHFGNRTEETNRFSFVLKKCSYLFDGIITVNESLKNWALLNLSCKQVVFLPNFVSDSDIPLQEETKLKGVDGKRIVFLANLKAPKNHLQLLKSFKEVQKLYPDWTIHLIGKDFDDVYAANLHAFIDEFNLHDSVFIYGICTDIENIMKQATVGVLGSTYEGFPVTLLEYGKASLLVLTTNVGYCSKVILADETGFLFDPYNLEELTAQFKKLVSSVENGDAKVLGFGAKLYASIQQKYAQKIVMERYLNFLKDLF